MASSVSHSKEQIVQEIEKTGEETCYQLAACYGESATAKLPGQGASSRVSLATKTIPLTSKFIILPFPLTSQAIVILVV